MRRYKNSATADIASDIGSAAARHLLDHPGLRRQAARRIKLLRAIESLRDLKGTGFGLDSLSGSRTGQWAIKINDQYRICFKWDGVDAYDIEIVDYH